MSNPLPPPQTPDENREANRRWLNAVCDAVFDGSPEAMADGLDLDDADRVVLRRVLSGAAQLVPDDIMEKAVAVVARRADAADEPLNLSPSTSDPPDPPADDEDTGRVDEPDDEPWSASAPTDGLDGHDAGGETDAPSAADLPGDLSADDAPTQEDLRAALQRDAGEATVAVFDLYHLHGMCLLQLARGRRAARGRAELVEEGRTAAPASDDDPPLTLPIRHAQAGMLAEERPERPRDPSSDSSQESEPGVSVVLDLPSTDPAEGALDGAVWLCRWNGRLSVRRGTTHGDTATLRCPRGRSEPVEVDLDDPAFQVIGTIRAVYRRL